MLNSAPIEFAFSDYKSKFKSMDLWTVAENVCNSSIALSIVTRASLSGTAILFHLVGFTSLHEVGCFNSSCLDLIEDSIERDCKDGN